MKYKYNEVVHLIGYGSVKVIAVNTNESYSNLTTYDLKDVLEDGLNTFYSVSDERIERIKEVTGRPPCDCTGGEFCNYCACLRSTYENIS